ncbi:hypothetical protein TPHA_0L02130 [Tetrapisispora phaffii CBS 4417]|uniref:Raptor N-terminal CASPase-like domain-containing protein n=1 Tax=Tetrapisispora phaffii (strain ATCC 24235 / CBS 4417 / NBRC 1672 / NRRL Y-8282 / UCD 70-5) TaxID=1071381 RepID=G8C086_TETPH|nr:hypothetical protein TPHA_0L02130 [Tetrapisispora phaffii CBS 4417]CCE65564.1 hypothetical protein TPHA_0L02130 [Tetrapisispora phaffii CBS 4417]
MTIFGPQPLRPLNTETRHGFEEQYNSKEFLEALANSFLFYYDDKRHLTNGNPVPDDEIKEDKNRYYQPILDWKIMKDRQKTVSVALLLCLNLGVDPPDVIKTQPCARVEAGIDPLNFQDSKKAIEQIGENLQSQYESLSLRARFKQSLDPSVEDVKRFCYSLRRTSKEDRILFHYNGHGVPKPTPSGEIWVFNRGYTQYIPVSLYDLQTWLGAPCIFVYDCNCAENIVSNFQTFVQKRIKDDESGKHDPAAPSPTIAYSECFQLAACRSNELLQTAVELPADLFTCCLTNPIEISVKVFLLQSPLNKSKYRVFFESQDSNDRIDFNDDISGIAPKIKIPGTISDRRTPLGELNWIFTAITDTIAWTSLPRPLFKKLFRHDLMVAALFRNFLLAKRIMPLYNCHPVSDPHLPDIVADHPMWKSWDLAIDELLSKLVADMENSKFTDTESTALFNQDDSLQLHINTGSQEQRPQNSRMPSRFAAGNLSNMSLAAHPSLHNRGKESVTSLKNVPQVKKQFTDFFEQNLTAFELWLKYYSNSRNPPEQLPIVLQVLLSQVHRIRALVLLSRFLDLGPWAVYLSLSIGIFPYVLKLLQSPAPELKPILVFIWARIMAIDYKSIQSDLLKEKGYMYFVNILIADYGATLEGGESSLNNNPQITMTIPHLNNPVFYQNNGRLPGAFPYNETTDEQKAMAVFILAAFIRDFPQAQKQCFSIELINMLSYYLLYSDIPLLRQWSAILLGQFCDHNPLNKYIYMDLDITSSLIKALTDLVPEVRAASLNALSYFISEADDVETLLGIEKEYTYHLQQLHTQLQQFKTANHRQNQQLEQQQMNLERQIQIYQNMQARLQNVDFSLLKVQGIYNVVAILKLVEDGSPFVRKEVIIFLSKFVHRYINFFVVVFFEFLVDELIQLDNIGKNNVLKVNKNNVSHGSIFSSVWKTLLIFSCDPFEENKELANKVIDYIFFEVNMNKEFKVSLRKIGENLIKRSSNWNQKQANSFNASHIQVIGKQDSKFHSNRDENSSDEKESLSGQFFLTKIFNSLGFGENYGSDTFSSSYSRTESGPPSRRSHLEDGVLNRPKRVNIDPINKEYTLPLKGQFLDFCFEYFQEPQMKKHEIDEVGSVEYNTRLWRRNRNEEIIEKTQSEKTLALYGNWNNRISIFDNKSQPKLLEFTQFDNYLVAADERDCITVYDWANDDVLNKFSNDNPYGTKITSLKFLNEDDSSLLLTGSSDGILKIYKDIDKNGNTTIVSAWRGLTDMLLTPRSTGLLTEWQQSKGSLLVTGDVKVIRVWDAHSESIEVDIPVKTSSLVTSITSDQLAGDTVVCGFSDGSIRVYDRRLNSRDAMVRLWRSNEGKKHYPINYVHLQRGGFRELASGTTDGTVELWDIRNQDPITSFNIGSSNQSSESRISTMTKMQLHEHGPILATGTKQVSIWTTAGDLLSTFDNTSHNSGIVGTFGASGIRSSLTLANSNSGSFLSSLAFHPHRMMLAASNSHDSKISIYSCENKFD